MDGETRQTEGRPWPGWARGLVSALLGFHLLAMLAVALSGAPASALERSAVEPFVGYVEAIDQGRVHRYYAPAPPPTPVLTAELHFGEGEPSRSVRLPDRSVRPRIRYQRQLALANHLYNEFRMARSDPHGSRPSRWGASYARHLCEANPGCTAVTIRVQEHRVPDLVRLRHMAGPGRPLPDVDDERFYTVPEVVGDYPCPGH
jgi:hypothetical protein